jgi:cytochrome P450
LPRGSLTLKSARFGRSTNTLASPTEKALNFASSFDYALMTSVNRSRLGWISFLKPDKKFDNAVATCRKFMDEYIADAIADDKVKERPYVFLNELVASGASKDEMRDQLMGLIIGGRDTTASTMTALFWTLVRRPDVMGKLRDEVATLEGQKPSWEELKNLKYLNMVLKESAHCQDSFSSIKMLTVVLALRLWSPIISNIRTAAKDTVLPRGGGRDGQSPIFVPKGTSCRWTLHSLHRRKDIYGEDAGDFKPERWETLRPS